MTNSTHTRSDRPGVCLRVMMTPPAHDAPWTAVTTLTRPGRDDTTRDVVLVPGSFDDARKAMCALALATLANA